MSPVDGSDESSENGSSSVTSSGSSGGDSSSSSSSLLSSAGSRSSEITSSSSDGSSSHEGDDSEMKQDTDSIPETLQVQEPPLLPRVRPMPRRSGAPLPVLPVAYPIRDHRNASLRHYHKVGTGMVRVSRNARRAKRNALVPPGYPPPVDLASSSSSDSESSVEDGGGLGMRWTEETVDFYELEKMTTWGEDNLFNIIPVSDISRLVGWATHHNHDGELDDSTRSKTTGRKRKRPPHNPLLFLPNAPLPPSFLRYIAKEVSEPLKKLKSSQVDYEEVWNERTFLGHSDSEDDSKMKKRSKAELKREDWQKWAYDDNDQTYQWLKKNYRKTEKVAMHVPIDPNKTRPKNDSLRVPDNAKTSPALLMEAFDCSALVALGMVWEEMVTASLLPLARRYVDRCRAMELRSSEVEPTGAEAIWIDLRFDSFRDWTLPPNEAVLKLAEEQYIASTGLPSASECLPSASPPLWKPVTRNADAHDASPDSRDRLQRWCRRQGMSLSFVKANMDLFRALIPCGSDEASGPS